MGGKIKSASAPAAAFLPPVPEPTPRKHKPLTKSPSKPAASAATMVTATTQQQQNKAARRTRLFGGGGMPQPTDKTNRGKARYQAPNSDLTTFDHGACVGPLASIPLHLQDEARRP